MYDIFHVFGEKKGWIYDINPLQADNSHEIPSHIQCLKAVTRFENVVSCKILVAFSGLILYFVAQKWNSEPMIKAFTRQNS